VEGLTHLCALLGVAADRLEALGNGPSPACRRIGGQAGDLACAISCSFQRFVEHAGEAREPLLKIIALLLQRRDQLLQ
jgi:hypothetical protein